MTMQKYFERALPTLSDEELSIIVQTGELLLYLYEEQAWQIQLSDYTFSPRPEDTDWWRVNVEDFWESRAPQDLAPKIEELDDLFDAFDLLDALAVDYLSILQQ